jgi:hypothetical protein
MPRGSITMRRGFELLAKYLWENPQTLKAIREFVENR